MSRRDSEEDKRGLPPWRLFALVSVIVLGIWAVWLWLAGGLPSADAQLAERGQFGDAFGALNALFAGLAFAGVIAALVLQMRELGLQREELRLTRREVEKQRKELAKQVATPELQRHLQFLDLYIELLSWRSKGHHDDNCHHSNPRRLMALSSL